MRSKYEIFKIGIKDVAPHLLSVFPFGIIFGAIGIELGFSPLFTYATVSYTHLRAHETS